MERAALLRVLGRGSRDGASEEGYLREGCLEEALISWEMFVAPILPTNLRSETPQPPSDLQASEEHQAWRRSTERRGIRLDLG